MEDLFVSRGPLRNCKLSCAFETSSSGAFSID